MGPKRQPKQVSWFSITRQAEHAKTHMPAFTQMCQFEERGKKKISTRLIATQREHLILMRFSELPEMGEGKPPSENAPFSLTNTPGAQEVNTPYVVTLAQTFF